MHFRLLTLCLTLLGAQTYSMDADPESDSDSVPYIFEHDGTEWDLELDPNTTGQERRLVDGLINDITQKHDYEATKNFAELVQHHQLLWHPIDASRAFHGAMCRNLPSTNIILKVFNPDVNYQDTGEDSENGRTALHYASYYGNTAAINAIANSGQIVNFQIQDNNGDTPMHFAKDVNTTVVLIANGANITMQNRQGLTCLDRAAQSENSDGVALLLSTQEISQKHIQETAKKLDDDNPIKMMLLNSSRSMKGLSADQKHTHNFIFRQRAVNTAGAPKQLKIKGGMALGFTVKCGNMFDYLKTREIDTSKHRPALFKHYGKPPRWKIAPKNIES